MTHFWKRLHIQRGGVRSRPCVSAHAAAECNARITRRARARASLRTALTLRAQSGALRVGFGSLFLIIDLRRARLACGKYYGLCTISEVFLRVSALKLTTKIAPRYTIGRKKHFHCNIIM